MMIVFQWLPITVLLIGLVIKIIALGTIPRNRRPSSSLAWLLLITVTPVFGLLLFFLVVTVLAENGGDQEAHQSQHRCPEYQNAQTPHRCPPEKDSRCFAVPWEIPYVQL